MTYAEFRKWAWECHGYRIPTSGDIQGLRAAWHDGPTAIGRSRSGSGVGTGHRAIYGPAQQRRLAFWLRARHLIDKMHLATWLDAAEPYVFGWLVNQGDGIHWVADPADDWKQLLATGFVAIRCGAEPDMKEPE